MSFENKNINYLSIKILQIKQNLKIGTKKPPKGGFCCDLLW
ncbi:hypothetical protein FORMA_09850 [Formosa sp. Hel3_A1_48]|nr:hypothetical protein FORMA_09850 [Formosa sp. Hel3_A1_48]